MSAIRNLKKQIAEAQARLEQETSKLQAERAQLVARLAQIDSELGGEAPKVKTRAKGVSEAVVAFVAAHPASTIKQVQEGLPDVPAAAVEGAVRSLAQKGTLTKDESTPRKFSVPAPEEKNGAKKTVNSGQTRGLGAS